MARLLSLRPLRLRTISLRSILPGSEAVSNRPLEFLRVVLASSNSNPWSCVQLCWMMETFGNIYRNQFFFDGKTPWFPLTFSNDPIQCDTWPRTEARNFRKWSSQARYTWQLLPPDLILATWPKTRNLHLGSGCYQQLHLHPTLSNNKMTTAHTFEKHSSFQTVRQVSATFSYILECVFPKIRNLFFSPKSETSITVSVHQTVYLKSSFFLTSTADCSGFSEALTTKKIKVTASNTTEVQPVGTSMAPYGQREWNGFELHGFEKKYGPWTSLNWDCSSGIVLCFF